MEKPRTGPTARQGIHPAAPQHEQQQQRSRQIRDDVSEKDSKPSHESTLGGRHYANISHDPEKQPPPSEPWWKERRKSTGREDPFANEEGAEVKYRTMEWWQASMIMIAETISLGILSLPSVLATVGMAPGVVLIAGLGILATYTGYVIGQFKQKYPHVHNMADAGEVLAGAWGREIGGAAQTIFLIFTMGSHVLTFTIALNVITGHATCTIVWGVVALVLLWIFTLPRTLRRVSYFSIACKLLGCLITFQDPHTVIAFMSITTAVLITMIALGIRPKPDLHIVATATASFSDAFLSVTNIIFAYAGHVAFFSFISELKDPRDFPKALYLLQTVDTTMYVVVAVVAYRYAGANVSSPALGSTGSVVRRVSYGIALPTVSMPSLTYPRQTI